MNGKVSMYDALKRMHQLTDAGVPFKIMFYTTTGKLKVVEQALLRCGYRDDQSSKSGVLIAYTDVRTNEHRQFHRSLLMEFNNSVVS